MSSLQNRIDRLKRERKIVQDQMAMAEGELKKTEDLLKQLSDSKKVHLTNCNVHILFLGPSVLIPHQ